jgi:tetratricopeptide (TPR) repeat protein
MNEKFISNPDDTLPQDLDIEAKIEAANTKFDGTLFYNYILNEIRSQEDAAKQLISVNSVLIGVYIAFMANSLTLEAIRTFLIFIPYPKYSVYIVLLPIVSWFSSIIYCGRILDPRVEKSEILFDKNKHIGYLRDIAGSKHKLLKQSYFFLGFGLFLIVVIIALAIPYQLIGIEVTWKNKGDILFDQGKYNESMQAYDKAIELNPRYSEAWNGKGKILFEQGKYNESMQAYDKAIELNPRYSEAWNSKGEVFFEQGMYNESEHCFTYAFLIDSRNLAALNNAGKVRYMLGNYEGAYIAFSLAKDFGYDKNVKFDQKMFSDTKKKFEDTRLDFPLISTLKVDQ